MDIQGYSGLLHLCRLCAQTCNPDHSRNLTDFIDIVEQTNEKIPLQGLIEFCLDIEVSSNKSPILPSHVCQECIGRLTFCYNFRMYCHRNDNFFKGFIQPSDDPIAIKQEPIDTNKIAMNQNQHQRDAFNYDNFDSQGLLEVMKDEPINADIFLTPALKTKLEENAKNAMRARLKRLNETLEQREIRLKRIAERVRQKRMRDRVENPSLYKERLAREAQRVRIRRQMLSEEQKNYIRAKEAETARIRRLSENEEKKSLRLMKGREAARRRRSTCDRSSISGMSASPSYET